MATSPSRRSELVRSLYSTFIAGDRPEMEALLADDFTFTSPTDDHIDKAEYSSAAGPTATRSAISRSRPCAWTAMQRSCATARSGWRTRRDSAIRSTWFARGERIRAVEVYFGSEIA